MRFSERLCTNLAISVCRHCRCSAHTVTLGWSFAAWVSSPAGLSHGWANPPLPVGKGGQPDGSVTTSAGSWQLQIPACRAIWEGWAGAGSGSQGPAQATMRLRCFGIAGRSTNDTSNPAEHTWPLCSPQRSALQARTFLLYPSWHSSVLCDSPDSVALN